MDELKILGVFKLQKDEDTAVPAPTTFGVLRVDLAMDTGISQMPQGSSPPGSSCIDMILQYNSDINAYCLSRAMQNPVCHCLTIRSLFNL
jgi:hypothetical protein